jgi:hypothetical protein
MNSQVLAHYISNDVFELANLTLARNNNWTYGPRGITVGDLESVSKCGFLRIAAGFRINVAVTLNRQLNI